MNSYKCANCLQPNHSFSDCTEVKCLCACVAELSSLPKNTDLEKMHPSSPKFLRIKSVEIAGLLYPYKQMNEFMRIRVKEQVLDKKVDRRLKEGAY